MEFISDFFVLKDYRCGLKQSSALFLTASLHTMRASPRSVSVNQSHPAGAAGFQHPGKSPARLPSFPPQGWRRRAWGDVKC